jgi:hypothetical protein
MASSTNAVRYGQVNREYGMRLASTAPADDGPVWMVNLTKYRETADYGARRCPALGYRAASTHR